MNYVKFQTATRVLALATCLFSAGEALAATQEYNLRAVRMTLHLPDAGAGQDIPMWGLQLDDGSGAPAPTTPWTPGPQLAANPGDKLVIKLRNYLPEEVSIVIPGQKSTDLGSPVFVSDPAYSRPGQPARVKSFVHETPPGGGTVISYTWDSVTSGTFLYHCGSHPAVTVQMGLYGALIVRSGENQPYPGITSYVELDPLLYSEVDPEVHKAVGASGSVKKYGPGPQFLASDLPDASAFYTFLKGQSDLNNHFASYLLGSLPSFSLVPHSADDLLNDLNAILLAPATYIDPLDTDTFGANGLNLSDATAAQLALAPIADQPEIGAQHVDLVRLNRMLIQDALAQALPTSPTFTPLVDMSSTVRSYPRFFLINGKPFDSTSVDPLSPPFFNTARTILSGQPVLLRFLNAGYDTHIPVIATFGDLSLIAEDGSPYTYPRQSYSVYMPALKTIDALWTPSVANPLVATFVPMADRRLGLVNDTASSGGMLTYFKVSAGATLGSVTIAPKPLTLSDGGSGAFTATVTGAPASPPVTYAWFKNNVQIQGQTGPSLPLSNVTLADAGNYSVSASAGGPAVSDSAVLVVNPVQIDVALELQPSGQFRRVGGSAHFVATVTGGGSAPLTYQWFKDGNPVTIGGRISSPTAKELVVSSLISADSGAYTVRVSSTPYPALTPKISNPVSLRVIAIPQITASPARLQVKLVGEQAIFAVSASADLNSPNQYALYRDGVLVGTQPGASFMVPISDATSASSQPEVGTYVVRVFNEAYDAGDPTSYGTSAGAYLAVARPYYTGGVDADTLANQRLIEVVGLESGTPSVNLFEVFSPSGVTLTYQWRRNGSAVQNSGNGNTGYAGASTATLSVSYSQNTPLVNRIGAFLARVTTAGPGSVTVDSSPMNLYVRRVITVTANGLIPRNTPANNKGGTVTAGTSLPTGSLNNGTIPNESRADTSLYPASFSLNTPNGAGTVKAINLTLNGLTHQRISDVRALLVSLIPNGDNNPPTRSANFLLAAGGDNAIASSTLTFQDGGSAAAVPLVSGATYAPIVNAVASTPKRMARFANATPDAWNTGTLSYGTAFSTFLGLASNDGNNQQRIWRLFLADDNRTDFTGSLIGATVRVTYGP